MLSFIRKIIVYISELRQIRRQFVLKCLGVKIGKKCFISNSAWIDIRRGQVNIGDRCTITHGAKILCHSATDKLLNPDYIGTPSITTIEDDVFIGMNAIILHNIRIGNHSIIGAGSVVVSDIPPYSLAVGNPARVIKTLNK